MTYLSIFRIIDIFSQFQARYSGISQEQFMHILNIHHPCHPRMHATQTLMCALFQIRLTVYSSKKPSFLKFLDIVNRHLKVYPTCYSKFGTFTWMSL